MREGPKGAKVKKFALAAIPLAAALAVAAYVFLTGPPAGTKAPAESAPAPEQASSGGLPDTEPARAAQKSSGSATRAAEERQPQRESKKRGDLTVFSMSHGDIGYVDVNSILQDRDPYSLVHLLQAHSDLTGADDSLEIVIEQISENEIWGQAARFRQLIEGQPTHEVGQIFFTPSGAVTRVYGDILDPQALADVPVLILPAEAEAIAYEAARRYAASLEPTVRPERRHRPWEIAAGSAVMRYRLDSEDHLFRLWEVPVSLKGPKGDVAMVSLSPETGDVISVRSTVEYSSSSRQRSTVEHSRSQWEWDRLLIVCDGSQTWKSRQALTSL